ncbi:MAG: sortase [Patescibacteria group bacterium]
MNSHTGIRRIIERPWAALGVFLVSFFVVASFLNIIDFVPETPSNEFATTTDTVENTDDMEVTVTLNQLEIKARASENLNLIAGPAPTIMARTGAVTGEVPMRVVIDKVGINTKVLNPIKSDLTTLDNELLGGAVRYPHSATLNEEGSVLIFGHQSYLPVVKNKAFKAFNDVQKLAPGDEVRVYSENKMYTYTVRSIVLVHADVSSVSLETTGHTLTLVTCNSLGTKEERYILKADLISITNATS